MLVTFILNNVRVSYDVRPDEYLAETLRSHGVKSVKVGCDETSCGSCTLLVDDKPVMSCGVLTASIENKKVTTVEGIQEEAKKISHCFSEQGADQCGFCNAGYALVIYSLKKNYKNPTDEEIIDYVVGNLCRCSGLQSQIKAIKAYLKEE